MDWRWILNHKILHPDVTYWNEHEQQVTRIILKEHGRLFIDIGSNKGYYSRLAKKRFEKVISIEPDTRFNYNHPMRYIVSDTNGLVPVYRNDENGFLTATKDFHFQGRDIPTRFQNHIRAVTFDDLSLEAEMVKIDVEGEELKILKGINKFRPKKIIVELHDERNEKELYSLLLEKGYSIEKISGYHYLAELESATASDRSTRQV